MQSIEIRKIGAREVAWFESLLNLFNIAFEEERSLGSTAHLSKILSDDRFIALAAFSGDRVIGGLTAHELPLYFEEGSEILIYDMAVAPRHQRTGVGKRLIQGLKDHCRRAGINEFFVLAHEEDEHALNFYRSTGGRGEKVMNFVYQALE